MAPFNNLQHKPLTLSAAGHIIQHVILPATAAAKHSPTIMLYNTTACFLHCRRAPDMEMPAICCWGYYTACHSACYCCCCCKPFTSCHVLQMGSCIWWGCHSWHFVRWGWLVATELLYHIYHCIVLCTTPLPDSLPADGQLHLMWRCQVAAGGDIIQHVIVLATAAATHSRSCHVLQMRSCTWYGGATSLPLNYHTIHHIYHCIVLLHNTIA